MRDKLKQFGRGIVTALAAGIILAAFHTTNAEARPVPGKKVTSITIKQTGNPLLINKRERKKLSVKVRPKNAANQKLTWKTSKKSVVSVTQNGVIRGRKYGKAVVTAQAKDGSGKKAKIHVQVGRKVSKVALPAKTMILDVKAKTKMKATVSPSNATKRNLTYRSSNKGVATVSSTGVVYGKAKGTATITVSSKDGSGKKANCKVQVKIPSQSVVIDVDATGNKIEVGKTLTVNAVVQPANASNKGIRYTSTNPAVAKVNQQGVVTGVASGTTSILVEAADGRSAATVEVEVYKVELRGEKLIAHRGLSSEAPENTTAAFELALQRGFYGIECDVRKTLDDNFVIMHDDGLNRMCGYNLKIANMDLQQLKKYKITSGANVLSYPDLTVPTLEEYLTILEKSDTIHPFIELKESFSSTDLKKLVQLVKKHGLLDRTYFISYYQSNLLALKEIDGVNREFLQYVYGAEEANKLAPVDDRVINWCIENGIDLDARHTLIQASDVYRLHEAGRRVNVWTVNALAKAFELVTNAQVDMITTEYYLNS